MEDLTYEQALTELQSLIDRLQEGNVPLDELQSRIKRAGALLEYCREKLREAESDSEQLLERLGGLEGDVPST